jgi:hypothetical protein
VARRTSKEPWDFSALPGWIYDIRVRPEFRRSGLGRALLGKAGEWAGEVGLAQVGLHVFGNNTAAINLYTSSGYQTIYSYLQKDLDRNRIKTPTNTLSFRVYQPEGDLGFTRQMLFNQFRTRALSSADPNPEEIRLGFDKCLKNFSFGNPNKELVIAVNGRGTPVGVLWFYKSKGDLGKRRYIWLHAAQATNPHDTPILLNYLEEWALENDLDAIRTPLHHSETQFGNTLQSFGYSPANMFMYKNISG